MAITEEKVLAYVKHGLDGNTLQVEWEDRILRDGVVISRTPINKAYGVAQKADFIIDVGAVKAAPYITLAGW